MATASSTIAWNCTEWPATASARPAQRASSPLRAALRIAAIIALFAVCAPLHLLTRFVRGRSGWPPWFLGSVGWIAGARARLVGPPVAPHSLLIANHSSWLDILVMGGAVGSAFVSKDTLGHPMIHWLADQNDTVYVRRSHVKGAKDQALAIAQALERDKPVALFPEGTTGPGTHLLPFRSTLLEAANYAAKDVAIRPVAIDYGDAAAEVGWWEESGAANLLRILGRRGTLPVTIRLLPPLDRSGDRKRLTAEARVAIGDSLGFKSPPHSPIGSGQ